VTFKTEEELRAFQPQLPEVIIQHILAIQHNLALQVWRERGSKSNGWCARPSQMLMPGFCWNCIANQPRCGMYAGRRWRRTRSSGRSRRDLKSHEERQTLMLWRDQEGQTLSTLC
jgi:hypothetical protein